MAQNAKAQAIKLANAVKLQAAVRALLSPRARRLLHVLPVFYCLTCMHTATMQHPTMSCNVAIWWLQVTKDTVESSDTYKKMGQVPHPSIFTPFSGFCT